MKRLTFHRIFAISVLIVLSFPMIMNTGQGFSTVFLLKPLRFELVDPYANVTRSYIIYAPTEINSSVRDAFVSFGGNITQGPFLS